MFQQTKILKVIIQYNNAIIETPLSQDDIDALRVILNENGFELGEVPLKDNLEAIQRFLIEKGNEELAKSILEKLEEGIYVIV